jgi:hypothetical protein
MPDGPLTAATWLDVPQSGGVAVLLPVAGYCPRPARPLVGGAAAGPPNSSLEWLLVLAAISPCGRQGSADEVADFVALDAGARVEQGGVSVAVQGE